MNDETLRILKDLVAWLELESKRSGDLSRKPGGDQVTFQTGIRRGLMRAADHIIYLLEEDKH